MCYMTKCPYVPPHPWNLDFPAPDAAGQGGQVQKGRIAARDKLLTATDAVGNLAGIPVIAQVVNAANRKLAVRRLMDKVIGVHPEAHLPEYHSDSLRKRIKRHGKDAPQSVATRGDEGQGGAVRHLLRQPQRTADRRGSDRDLRAQWHPVVLMEDERCCGMPKLELGDLEAVQRAKEFNIPRLARWVEEGWDIVGPVPSCVLMLKQEYPLLFPDDEQVRMVSRATYDPFEYLMLRHKEGRLKTDFKQPLGKVAYHTACHLRVQNIGYKTRDLLQLVPQTSVEVIERCSGHDGTYGVKSETFAIAAKICRPVVNKVKGAGADHYTSDCPIAGHHIGNGLRDGSDATHPLTLLRTAYEI
jgi:glycerol-3-phosphate dehydrogenase subunit C